MIEHVVWVVAHLAGLSLILLTAWGLGHLCLRTVPFDSATERWTFTTALGLALCGVALFWLGLLGLLHRGVLLGLTGAAVLATGLALVRRRPVREHAPPTPRGRRRALAVGLVAAAVAYWALLLIVIQYPPVQFDAVWYHLVLARTYLDENRLVLHGGAGTPCFPP